MRPRSRLLSKRRLLLPTIREGSEETVRDLNSANTLITSGHDQAVSSEDYFLSICHLAHPTFPSRDISSYIFHSQQLDTMNRRLRPSWVTETPSSQDIHEQQREGKELHEGGIYGSSDPLEYLYGHQNGLTGGLRAALVERRFAQHHGSVWEGRARTRAHSIPRSSSPDIAHQRKGSCPELHANTLVPNISPTHVRRGRAAEPGSEGERHNPAIKQSLLSQWISDCRSAWREARARACMLPAIAEI